MKTRGWLTLYSALILVCLLSLPSYSWNKASHMATGAIAYRFLQQSSPATVAKAVKILKNHPHFASLWKSKYDSLPAVQRDVFLFMVAARWPDDVKGTNYDHPAWHHYEYPITFLPTPTGPPEPDNSLTEFKANLNIVTSNASDANRAIALCWVFHLMGDLHQPLNNVTLFSEAFPAGDHGGRDFLIKDPAKDLHQYWDDLFLSDAKVSYKLASWFSAADNAATSAKTKNGGVIFNSVATIDTKAISNEGIEMAKASVYKFKNKLLKAGVKGGAAAVALPPGYSTEAAKIASKQLTLTGMRIALVVFQNIH